MNCKKRTETFKTTLRKHQLYKGDLWILYKFKCRFESDTVPQDISFWDFKHELGLYLKDPKSSKYTDLFLALSNELVILRAHND